LYAGPIPAGAAKLLTMNYTKINQTPYKGVEVEELPTKLESNFTKFRRAPFGSRRLYFNKRDPFFYSGLTTPIGALANKSHLNKAAVNMAYQGRSADFEWNERANYGTCFHLLVGMHEEGDLTFDFDARSWKNVVDSFIQEYHYQDYAGRWFSDIQNDMYAYFQWKKASNVKVLSTEIVVHNAAYKIATPLDLIVEMDFNRKRILANVNFKTGDHPFAAENLLQVGMEKWLWNTSPERPFDLDGSFAWRPKNRRTSPGSYELSPNAKYNIPMFEYVAQSVDVLGLNEPSGKIVTFEGVGEEGIMTALSPQDWLADYQSRV
jgi:hypothetical protein